MLKRYIDYIKDNPQGFWFKRKLFGWGWVPATREGWLVTGVYLVLVLFIASTIDESSTGQEVALMVFLPVSILTALFLRIAYKTGEKPKWQWGVPKKK